MGWLPVLMVLLAISVMGNFVLGLFLLVNLSSLSKYAGLIYLEVQTIRGKPILDSEELAEEVSDEVVRKLTKANKPKPPAPPAS